MRRLERFGVWTAVALILSGCGAQKRTVVVEVTDHSLHALAGVPVVIVGTGIAGKTDTSGKASLRGLGRKGVFDIRATRGGRHADATVTVEGTDPAPVRIVLETRTAREVDASAASGRILVVLPDVLACGFDHHRSYAHCGTRSLAEHYDDSIDPRAVDVHGGPRAFSICAKVGSTYASKAAADAPIVLSATRPHACSL